MPHSRTTPSPTTHTPSRDLVAWVLITLGTGAIALGAWDLLIDQDGEAFPSLIAMAIGGLVVALGYARSRT